MDRLAELVSELLELQRLEYYELKPAAFDIGSLVEKVASQYETEAGAQRVEVLGAACRSPRRHDGGIRSGRCI